MHGFRRLLMLSTAVLRAPDDGAGAGTGASGAAGAGGAAGGNDAAAAAAASAAAAVAGAGGGAGVADGAASSPYRPDGLPDHLYGKSDKETIDQLHKAFSGYRTAEGQRTEKFGDVPKEASGYAVTIPDEAKPYLGDLSKDPIFLQAQKDAHEIGMPSKMFDQFVGKWMKQVVLGGGLEPPFDPQKEIDALISPQAVPDGAERAKEVDRRVRDNTAWLTALEARGMEKAAVQTLVSQLDTAAGIKAVEWMRAQLRETNPALGGAGAGGVSEADLRGRNADPRNTPGNAKYDEAFAAETTRLYQRFYGDAPRS